MDKIFHGLMKSPTLGYQEKLKVVNMLVQSGKQSHQTQEVTAVLKATLQYWLNSESSALNQECSEKIFKAWSKNNVMTMIEIVTKDMPVILNEIQSAANINHGGSHINVESTCQAISAVLCLTNQSPSFSNDDQKRHHRESVSTFTKNSLLYELLNHANSMRALSSIAVLLLEYPLIIPWETGSSLLNCVITKLSALMLQSEDDPIEFIKQAVRVSKLVKYVWSKAISPKTMILETLKTLFGIVASNKKLNDVSVALSTILQSVPEQMIAEICNNLVGDKQVSEEQLTNALSHMVTWLSWPKHLTIHYWIVNITKGLVLNGKLVVLFEITNEYALSIAKKLWYGNIQGTVLNVLSNLLLFHQRCPQAFHKCLPELIKVFESSDSQDTRRDISELIQVLMTIHPGYPELYLEPLSSVIADFPVVSEEAIQILVAKYTPSGPASSKGIRSAYSSSLSAQEERGEKVGLANLGNTCFLNSVVQALYNIDSVRSCLLTNDLSVQSKLLMQLQSVFTFLHQTSRPVISPNTYVNASLPGWFVLGEQQDSSEYLRFMMDNIHEQLNDIKDSSNTDFTELFTGNETIITKCLNCANESTRQQKFYDLSVHFPDDSNNQPVDLNVMIRKSLEPEQLRGDNQFHCDQCASLQDADRSVSDINLPSHLVLTLCRFSYNAKLGKNIKIRTPVHYPDNLEMGGEVYSLNAVIVHSGTSLNGGHYYTYAHNLCGNQQWYLFNDNRVTQCCNPAEMTSNMSVAKVNRLSSDTPYILFYTKQAKVHTVEAELTLSPSLRHLVVRDNLKYEEERHRNKKTQKQATGGGNNLSWYNYTDNDDDQPPPGTDRSLDLSGSRFIF